MLRTPWRQALAFVETLGSDDADGRRLSELMEKPGCPVAKDAARTLAQEGQNR